MRIAFLPVPGGKPWNGATIYESALGGSESAVAYLARELARRGHEVHVFSHGEGGEFEQVQYWHLNPQGVSIQELHQHLAHLKPEAVVVSRWFDILNAIPEGILRVLWLHDVRQPGPVQFPCHYVVCLTHWQAQQWQLEEPDGTVPDFLRIIGDGVDLSNFSSVGQLSRSEKRLIWASNPDRGLFLASKYFVEEVVQRWPDLELHVYGRASVYGWNASAETLHLPRREWLAEEGGPIHLHDPLPRLALSNVLMRSWAMWYPTFWPETFCMAALESQAAGTPVITTPVGALPETVKGGEVQFDVLNSVSRLRNVGRWNKMSEQGREQAANFSWARIAAQWEKLIEEGIS